MRAAPPVSIAPELAGRVRLGVLGLDGLTVQKSNVALDAEIASVAEGLRARYGDLRSGEVEGTEEARRLYKDLGLDPTKVRPSNEALLRRVLKGEVLSRVNTLVDALNLCSLTTQLPFGLYDLDHVSPPVVLRRGRMGEAYEGIRKGPVHVYERPVLADAQGPFGNPTSDSARTMITLGCRRALVIAYVPRGFDDGRLIAVAARTAEQLTKFCGGTLESSTIVR